MWIYLILCKLLCTGDWPHYRNASNPFFLFIVSTYNGDNIDEDKTGVGIDENVYPMSFDVDNFSVACDYLHNGNIVFVDGRYNQYQIALTFYILSSLPWFPCFSFTYK